MEMSLTLVGFILLMLALVQYFAKLKKSQTPKSPRLLKSTMFIASALSLWGLATINYHFTVEVALTVFFATNVLLTSATFAYFLATKSTPIGEIKVKVGDSLPHFELNGFNSESLKGKRILLKFYRGSWCPYCSAELVMFEALKPTLNKFNVEILGISNDSAQEQAAHIVRDAISMKLVSDLELSVIRQFGVEHHKGLGATAEDTIYLFGIAIPMPWKMKFKAMAIPTSILINECGKIVWIDQSEDYRIRASEKAVMDAVTANFAE